MSVRIRIEDLDNKLKTADKELNSLETSKKDLNRLISKKSKEMYESKKERLKIKIKASLFMSIFFNFLITILTAYNSETFTKDFKEFWLWIYNFLLNIPGIIESIFEYSIYDEGRVTDFIESQFHLIDWIIIALKLGGIILVIALFIGIIKLVLDHYKEELSIWIAMIDLVIVVFLSDSIKPILDINLILLFVVIYITYLIIRFLKEK